MVAFNNRHFCRTNRSASMTKVDHVRAILSIPRDPFSEPDSIDFRVRGR